MPRTKNKNDYVPSLRLQVMKSNKKISGQVEDNHEKVKNYFPEITPDENFLYLEDFVFSLKPSPPPPFLRNVLLDIFKTLPCILFSANFRKIFLCNKGYVNYKMFIDIETDKRSKISVSLK